MEITGGNDANNEEDDNSKKYYMKKGEYMSAEVLERLQKAILEYDEDEAANYARKVVEEGIDPVEALNAMTVAIRQIGDGFGRGELFLPDLVGAADAMSAATPILEEEISKSGKAWELSL